MLFELIKKVLEWLWIYYFSVIQLIWLWQVYLLFRESKQHAPDLNKFWKFRHIVVQIYIHGGFELGFIQQLPCFIALNQSQLKLNLFLFVGKLLLNLWFICRNDVFFVLLHDNLNVLQLDLFLQEGQDISKEHFLLLLLPLLNKETDLAVNGL